MSIQTILEEITKGLIRIPAFQRGFVWEPDRVATLMDSIYKRYPFGTILLWRTNARLKHDRKLGPFEIPKAAESYPVEYVLDGQQRLTAIFCVFKAGLEADPKFEWRDIYFDLSADLNAQDQQFVAVGENEVDPAVHFPLRAIFDSPEYRRLTKDYDEELAGRVDAVSRAFQQVQIPSYVYQTEEKAVVSVIFERINKQGVPLDTLQLLSAWTWSEDFQLQAEFDQLIEEVEDFGFGAAGVEENLLLRCCASILTRDAVPESLLRLTGNDVRIGFEKVKAGVKGAIDFVQSTFCVTRLTHLPFQTLIVPLAAFFASSGDRELKLTAKQNAKLRAWFWHTCLTRRYSSGVLRNLKSDIELMGRLREAPDTFNVGFDLSIDTNFFLDNQFKMTSVNSKTFILLLAQERPKSFVSSQFVDLTDKLRMSNRSEFHHIYPKAFLRGKTIKFADDCLANIAFLSRSDNRQIGDKAPSVYLNMIAENSRTEVLASAIIDEAALRSDDFDTFAETRATQLLETAKRLVTGC